MANHQENSNQQQQQGKHSQRKQDQLAVKKATPMIVERFYNIPVVSMAWTVGQTQYDKLKSSSVTVGDVIARAEGWAAFVWQKVQPIVDKLQDPISRADRLACNTLDFVEGKITQMSHVITTTGKTAAATAQAAK